MRRAALPLFVFLFACSSAEPRTAAERAAVVSYTDSRAWSSSPPGLEPVDVPQLVAVTFDDNFVSGLGDVSGGMTWATSFFEPLVNPAGSGYAPTFDGAKARTTFFGNCLYLDDELTRKSWNTAKDAGHELANHTVNHTHGGSFTQQNWLDEIAPCSARLTDPEGGIALPVDALRGFRAPFLEYSPDLFGALKTQGLWYDSSIQSCWGQAENGKNCAWPYTLDQGSADAVELTRRFAVPTVPSASGLWEMTTSALFVPPDELATQYGFEPGLRARVPTDMPAPSFYEATTGRIAPLDVTLFVDAGLSATEVLATLKYTLDLRLSGNRAPLIFVAHTHVYASNYGAAPKASDVGDRQRALEDFVRDALSKDVVRMRPVADLLGWLQKPQPLNGVVTAKPAVGGAGGMSGASAAGMGGSLAGGGGGGTSGGGGSGGAAAGNGPHMLAEPRANAGCSLVTAPKPTSLSNLGMAALWLLRRRQRSKVPQPPR